MLSGFFALPFAKQNLLSSLDFKYS